MDFEVKSDIVEIKFSGDIKPDSVSLEEISKELLLFNKLVKPIIEENFPNEKLPNDYVGLVDIGDRSLSFRYRIKDQIELTKKAFSILLIAVAQNDISTLPARTIEVLEKTSDFNVKYNCTAHFGVVERNDFVSYSSFTDNFKSGKIASLKAPATMYGYLNWIGGDIPHARLVLDDHSQIKINLTKDQARDYAKFLYGFITVDGIGTWKGTNLKLTSIDASEINVFENVSPEEGFAFLRKHLGEYLKDTDPNNIE